MFKATILTLFPEMFPGPLGHSLSGRALGAAWSIETVNLRDFAIDAYRTVDDTPFGGGPGMVMRPDVFERALDQREGPFVYLTPRGMPLKQAHVKKFIQDEKITLICGRYEGIDERVLRAYPILEISIGDYVLSGGELAAMVVLDACIRLLPGVMGDIHSAEEESFSGDLLEYPHYTRPRVWRGLSVPDVLTSGHHENIRLWRLNEAQRLTKERRPDLWAHYKR